MTRVFISGSSDGLGKMAAQLLISGVGPRRGSFVLRTQLSGTSPSITTAARTVPKVVRIGNPVSADELYHKCADEILQGGLNPRDTFQTRVLLEAATVAKSRAQTETQLRRAVS